MIKEVHFPLYSPEWKAWRWDHIGGSDIGAVCAGYHEELAETSWTPPLKYYLQMIGEPVEPFHGNVPSNMGQVLEPVIIDLYRCFDRTIPMDGSGTPFLDMFQKYHNGTRVNRIICRHNYSWNTDYPHLSCSVDGYMYEERGRGILEIKNMTSMEQSRYLNKMNPSHFLQCQHNMLCTGSEYCDLIRLTDGTWLDIVRLEINQKAWDTIIKSAGDFWTRVLEARRIKKEYNIDEYYDVNLEFFTKHQLEGVARLQAMEPDFTGTKIEMDWLKEFIKPAVDETCREMTEADVETLVEYKQAKEKKETYEKDVNKAIAKLTTTMNGCQVVESPLGYYSYKMTKGGYPRFYAQPKLLEAI